MGSEQDPDRMNLTVARVVFEVQGPDGSRWRQESVITEKPFYIGRREDADLKLMNDMTVSKDHAILAYQCGRMILTDTSTHESTMVNGKLMIAPRHEEGAAIVRNVAQLSPGTMLTFGETYVQIRW